MTGFGGFQLKLVRHLVVVDKTGVLADWRVQCEAPTLITENNVMSAPDPELARRLSFNSYSKALRELSLLLARRYMVFYDRESVLDALRLSLSIDCTTDIGLNPHVRNDALRFGGTFWCRSRRRLVEPDSLWVPLIGGRLPEDPVVRARGILQMFNRVSDPIPKPRLNFVPAWTLANEWFSRPTQFRELASLILLERGTRFVERTRRASQVPAVRLREPSHPASSFYFTLSHAHNLPPVKHEIVNRLLRIAPHHGLAFHVSLAEKGLISEALKDDLRREQTHRHLANDTSMRVYELAPDAGSHEKQRRLNATVKAFLGADDEALWVRARSAEWPEFE